MSKHNKNYKHPSVKEKLTNQKVEITENTTSENSQQSEDIIVKTEVTKDRFIKPIIYDAKNQENVEITKGGEDKKVIKNSEDQLLEDDYAQIDKLVKSTPISKTKTEKTDKNETKEDYLYNNDDESKSSSLLLKTIFLIATLALLGYFVLGGSIKPSSNNTNQSPSSKIDKKPCINNNKKMDVPTNLKIEDTLAGTGKEVFSGCEIKIHYRGYLLQTQEEIVAKAEPKEFDNSFKRGVPFSTQIGVGKLIKGWDIGIIGMKEGGKRTLTIPAELAYGDIELSGIPAKSTLVFEVELIQVID
jgi:FKBP-type peptidyl-prolyl cis-trans isomerase FkpA